MLTQLTNEQINVIQCTNQPCAVLAGPGSGKTTVVTMKVANLIYQFGIPAERILAITFTNKASLEMKERIVQTTGIPVEDLRWVRTIHSFCLEILKTFSDRIGFKRPMSIYEKTKRKQLIQSVIDRMSMKKKEWKDVSKLISSAKNSIDPINYIKNGKNASRNLQIYQLYESLLKENNAVDFDGILLWAYELLRNHSDIKQEIRQFFQYVLVDEFQDCNDVQTAVLSLIVDNGKFTVVGDDYQSIYGFRNANPNNFINFINRYPNATAIRMEQNHRCTDVISFASNELIKKNKRQILKNCFSTKNGPLIEAKVFNNSYQEAYWVADYCKNLNMYQGIPFERIAILSRIHRQVFVPLEKALIKTGIPYQITSSIGMFERIEVRIVVSYLMCSVNPLDDTSFKYVLNIPKRGIGKEALLKMNGARSKGETLQQASAKAIQQKMLGEKASANLRYLLIGLQRIRDMKPADAIKFVLRDLGVDAYLKTKGESAKDTQERMDHVKFIIELAESKTKIEDFLEDITLFSNDRKETDTSGVKISTVHAAKGLEYDTVFFVALEEGIIPYFAARDHEEERRMMFVGMTRAERQLCLTWSKSRNGSLPGQPSRFLKEIPEICVRAY